MGGDRPAGGKFVSISAGYVYSTCGVKPDGSLECWSDGRSTTPDGEFDSVSAGVTHTCGVRVDGSVVCWGAQTRGLTESTLD